MVITSILVVLSVLSANNITSNNATASASTTIGEFKESYKVCYYPSHCIYFDKVYEPSKSKPAIVPVIYQNLYTMNFHFYKTPKVQEFQGFQGFQGFQNYFKWSMYILEKISESQKNIYVKICNTQRELTEWLNFI